jgi:hypothetical protein
VGYRAALGLLNVVFQQSVPYKGPTYASAQVTASLPCSATVTVAFDPATLYGQPLRLNTSVACPAQLNAESCEAWAVQTSDCAWNAVPASNVSLSSDGTQLVL